MQRGLKAFPEKFQHVWFEPCHHVASMNRMKIILKTGPPMRHCLAVRTLVFRDARMGQVLGCSSCSWDPNKAHTGIPPKKSPLHFYWEIIHSFTPKLLSLQMKITSGSCAKTYQMPVLPLAVVCGRLSCGTPWEKPCLSEFSCDPNMSSI